VQAFWTFLASIPDMNDRGNTPMTISIITDRNFKHVCETDLGRLFSWSDGEIGQCEAKFIGQLVVVAQRLKKKGIVIVDGEGRAVDLVAPKAEGHGTLAIPKYKYY
jgi:hypothetical protein